MAGGVGERAAVGAAAVELRLHVPHRPVELVADQHAVADDVPALGLHALVVVADGGQAVLDGAVAGDVHDVGAVLQRAELVVGRERRAGVVGLVAERPVELGGVADRLVDGQPQVRRVDDQVVAAGLDGRRLELLGQQLGHLVELGVPVVEAGGEVLPAAADREARCVRIESKVSAPAPIASTPGSTRTRCWVVTRAGQVGVVLVLLHLPDRRPSRGRRRRPARSRSVQSMSSAAFSAIGTSNGFTSYDETQVTSAYTGSGAISTGALVISRGHLGHRDRGLGHPARLVGGQHHPGGEPPGAAVDHPDREPDVVGVQRGLQHAVAHREVLVPDPLEAEVRVAGARAPGPGRGRPRRARGRGGR